LSDEIELIIKRDLDRLPVLAEERWIPPAPAGTAFGSVLANAGVLVAVLLFGLALGGTLATLREQAVRSASESSQATASPGPGTAASVVSRQSVLGHVRGLTLVVPRAERFEAKLVSSADVSAGFSVPAGSLLWVVAVSGDVHCGCVAPPPQPFHSALFWFDAHTGNVVASTQGPASWPEGFDALPDRSLAM
jgi:hypothetical protein